MAGSDYNPLAEAIRMRGGNYAPPPPSPKRSNASRARIAADFCRTSFAPTAHLHLDDLPSDSLVAGLTNLLHFAIRYDMDFDSCLEMARVLQIQESYEGWGE